MQAARWFSDVAEALGSASPKGAADLTAQIHRAVRGGAGGPRGVVIVAADGRADSKATAQFHTDLSRLYDLTRRSRFADWSVRSGADPSGAVLVIEFVRPNGGGGANLLRDALGGFISGAEGPRRVEH
jgi:hypothetical protein